MSLCTVLSHLKPTHIFAVWLPRNIVPTNLALYNTTASVIPGLKSCHTSSHVTDSKLSSNRYACLNKHCVREILYQPCCFPDLIISNRLPAHGHFLASWIWKQHLWNSGIPSLFFRPDPSNVPCLCTVSWSSLRWPMQQPPVVNPALKSRAAVATLVSVLHSPLRDSNFTLDLGILVAIKLRFYS